MSPALHSKLHLFAHEGRTVRMKQDFNFKSGLPSVIGCLDGIYVRIQAPSEHKYLYLNRRGSDSVNVQIVCNSDITITIYDLVASGLDQHTRESALHREFKARRLNGILLGDGRYPRDDPNLIESCIDLLKHR